VVDNFSISTAKLHRPTVPAVTLLLYFVGRLYDEYLGIPFAAPPVDELRWEKPQPVEPWGDLYNATQFSIHCTQFIAPIYIFVGMGGRSGEDCLYLNIWVPDGVRVNEYAVIVYYGNVIKMIGNLEVFVA